MTLRNIFESLSSRDGRDRSNQDSSGLASGGASERAGSHTRARRSASAGGHPGAIIMRTLAGAVERVGAGGHNVSARRGALAIALACLCMGSLVAPVAAAGVGAPPNAGGPASDQAGAPAGFADVPANNVGPPAHAGPPEDANIPTHASAWNIHASDHAGDLEIEIDANADGEPVIRASDHVNHDGRTIAVDADTLAGAVGHYPRVAYGAHSSGDEWVETIRYEDGYALVDVEKFSTNEITFDGEVVLEADPADDGSTFSYDVADEESVDNFSVELTGAMNEKTQSDQGSTDGASTETITTGGNRDPIDDTLTLSKHGVVYENSTDMVSDGGGNVTEYYADDVGGGADSIVDHFWVEIAVESTSDYPLDYEYDVYVAEDDIGDNVFTDGVYVGTVSYSDDGGVGYKYTRTESDVDLSGSAGLTVGLDENPDETRHVDQKKISAIETEGPQSYSQSIDVDGTTHTVDDDGDTEVDVDLSQDESTVGFDGDAVDWSLDWTARTITEDPVVDVNGESFSHDGVISEGETVSLDVDSSAVQAGENNVEVSVSSQYDPSGVVGLSYSHSATTDQTVDYRAEIWSEAYNVSQTWADDRSNASITIPFSSDQVVEIRDLEKRVNDGSWQEVSDYQLDGTTLTAQLGDMNEGDEVDVRAVGSKVQVDSGEIEILEPTIEGDLLDTQFEIVSHSESFEIVVNGTDAGNRLHYLDDVSWSGAEPRTVVDSDNGQVVRAPNAGVGSTARAKAMPLEVNPNAGEVEVDVLDVEDPRLAVAPSSSVSNVDYVWHDTISGDEYILYSETHDTERDSETANSPVTLSAAGYEEVLRIVHNSGGSGGGAGAVPAQSSGSLSNNPLLVSGFAIALIAGFAVVTTRTDIPMRATAGAGVLVALLALEAIAPGTISSAVSSTIVMVGSELGRVAPALALIAAGVSAYVIVSWWQARKKDATTPDTQVSLNLGNNK